MSHQLGTVILSAWLGLALAGATVLGFEMVTRRRASFTLLERPRGLLAWLPLMMVSAPFIILRNTVRGCRVEGRPVLAVAIAMGLSFGWSFASGSALTRVLAAAL